MSAVCICGVSCHAGLIQRSGEEQRERAESSYLSPNRFETAAAAAGRRGSTPPAGRGGEGGEREEEGDLKLIDGGKNHRPTLKSFELLFAQKKKKNSRVKFKAKSGG